ncbi:uncharacterized protein A4U43_C06F12510 [Asparagus officinalis]|uniref:Uncharacterized protein n=1 Tax=Asparagus officinalis TaxID=4686 RepID=A0A5P1ELP3_ASPOF|nr:uncharacterized protein A4U43_C06F12510 [Asparagus officinalis]
MHAQTVQKIPGIENPPQDMLNSPLPGKHDVLRNATTISDKGETLVTSDKGEALADKHAQEMLRNATPILISDKGETMVISDKGKALSNKHAQDKSIRSGCEFMTGLSKKNNRVDDVSLCEVFSAHEAMTFAYKVGFRNIALELALLLWLLLSTMQVTIILILVLYASIS